MEQSDIEDFQEDQGDRVLEQACGECRYDDNNGYQCSAPSEAIECFWGASVTDSMEEFDLDYNIDTLQRPMESKLAEHGLLGPDRYYDNIIERGMGADDIRIYTVDNDWVSISEDEIYRHVAEKMTEEMPEWEKEQRGPIRPQFVEDVFPDDERMQRHAAAFTAEKLSETFRDVPVFESMKETYSKSLELQGTDRRTEKVLLIDEMIHTEHVNGSIFYDVEDLEELRENFDEKYGLDS